MSSVTTTLTPPVGKRDHVQGIAAAVVTLVEYGDYQCPFCGDVYPVIHKLQQHFASQQDLQSGIESGVGGTPTLFINGVRNADADDFETLQAQIDEAILLAKATKGRRR